MTAVVKGGAGGSLSKLPSFQAAEKFMDTLAAVREAAVTARETTPDLLTQLDAAIAAVSAEEANFKKAAAPGKIVNVASYLALLLDVYANSGSRNAETFGGFLIDDVMELEPPVAAVEIACRRWRQQNDFAPKISEFLREVKAAKTRILNTQEFIARLPEIRTRVARDLGH